MPLDQITPDIVYLPQWIAYAFLFVVGLLVAASCVCCWLKDRDGRLP